MRALRLGACAIVILLVSAVAVASATTAAPRRAAAAQRTIERDRQVLRFFASHAWLLRDPRFAAEARRQVAAHRRSLAVTQRTLAGHHRRAGRTFRTRRLAAIATPAQVICREFGAAYCNQAVQVARCESGLRTDAINGQYLGLFQMGSTERRLFGHGESAEEQSRAAHRYFVFSGRDWSPWSCRPW